MQSRKFLNYNLEDVEKNMEDEDPQSQNMLRSQEKRKEHHKQEPEYQYIYRKTICII